MMRTIRSGTLLALAVAMLIPSMTSAAFTGSLQEIAPSPATFTESVDFNAFSTNAAVGDVTAGLQAVDIGSTSGCEAADFAGFIAGRIALLERGTCAFSDKVNNASAAGAVGALIFDNLVQPVGFFALADPTSIPALFLTNTLGTLFLSQVQSAPVTVHMAVVERAAVAEPATVAFLVLGIAVLALGRRRRPSRPAPGEAGLDITS